MFELKIDTENAAFEEDNGAQEVARILRDVADKLESGRDTFGHFRTLFDVNGNDVGRAKLHDNDAQKARDSEKRARARN